MCLHPRTPRCFPALYGGITTSKSAAQPPRERGENGGSGERGGRARCETRMKWKFKVIRHEKGEKHQEREWGAKWWKTLERTRGETQLTTWLLRRGFIERFLFNIFYSVFWFKTTQVNCWHPSGGSSSPLSWRQNCVCACKAATSRSTSDQEVSHVSRSQ